MNVVAVGATSMDKFGFRGCLIVVVKCIRAALFPTKHTANDKCQLIDSDEVFFRLIKCSSTAASIQMIEFKEGEKHAYVVLESTGGTLHH